MPANDIDDYLSGIDEPKRSTLAAVRATILEIVPDAEQCLSYGMPAFKVRGKAVAGFGAFKHHLGYFPHSGSVLAALGDAVAGYTITKGGLQFPVDVPLPRQLVEQLIAARVAELPAP